MKRFILSFVLFFAIGAAYAADYTLTVTSVESAPVTGITLITYNLTAQDPAKVYDVYNIVVEVSFDGGGSYIPVPPADLSGDVVDVTPGTGKQITWNGGASFPNRYSTETRVRLTANEFVCGQSTVTFTYNGSQVTYGTVEGVDGRCWLDRNLGANPSPNKTNGAENYGDLFQWGRAADGHQVRTSGTTTELSVSDTPGHGDFILSGDESPYDWRNPKNDNLWQGGNGDNNPCPAGWRVPTKEEWETELGLLGNSKNGSLLNLPAAGYRSEIGGAVVDIGVGYYWSSTVTGIFSYRVQTGSGMLLESRRADGFSVRCIKQPLR